MFRTKTFAKISFGLGILSILAVVASHLALTDIWHAEGDLSLEWNVLQVSITVIGFFQVFALITIGRFLKVKS